MILVTGDIHRDIERLVKICKIFNTTINDVLIILGDACINYFEDERDEQIKREIGRLPITLLCIHGNHEARPSSRNGHHRVGMLGGIVYRDNANSNINFAIDGEVYDIGGKKALAIGGAYSTDKFIRLMNGNKWFKDEQPDEATRKRVISKLSDIGHKVDFVMSHTCPKSYIFPDMCKLSSSGMMPESTIDYSTEMFLDRVELITDYNTWLCGHYHVDAAYKTVKGGELVVMHYRVLQLA